MLPWHWRSLPLHNLSGSQVFRALFLAAPSADGTSNAIATLLESPGQSGLAMSRYSICAGAPRIIDGQQQLWTPPLGEIMPCLRQLLHRGESPTTNLDLPFTGGWLGWLGYETAWELEKLPSLSPDPLPWPVAYWYEPANFAVLDHQQQLLHVAATDPADLVVMTERIATIDRSITTALTESSTPTIDFLTTAEDYQRSVLRAKEYIQAGDIYQANLSVRFTAVVPQSSWSIYQKLHQINPSPFASYWQTPWGAMISCSPERLVQFDGQIAQVRPIAGTRPRGVDDLQDQELAQTLLSNPKEIAEHIMLVDLERNDLGKVCEWGTVAVDELLSIERYSHVMHLVSNVRGKLAPGQDAIDLMAATFPGGTITGCPKVRCLEIIAELEPWPRNLFYGSCGYLDQRGHLDLNILIRTLLYHQGRVWGQVGAGIVADSDPVQEWIESLQKAKAQIQAIS
jgi:para-aminobenzoate synthetase component I